MLADGSRQYGLAVDRTQRSEIQTRIQPFIDALADESTHLDVLTLTMSAALNPALVIADSLAALDQLAADCPIQTPTPWYVVDHLCGAAGFAGDQHDYHSWRNSCLDQVIDRRRGMPITLVVLTIEVARRLGQRLLGVGMPGHFLVGDPLDTEWLADPFHGKSRLSRLDCQLLSNKINRFRWTDGFLTYGPDRWIIARMLNNLKASCERANDHVSLAIVMQLRHAMAEFDGEASEAERALFVLN
jgi:regulator of sirC expression with transglutaminase-like and TPR domain